MADLMDETIYITTPPTVEAGKPFNATINVQWHGLADSGYAHAFRIYLGASYEDQSFTSYLNYEQSLCDPTIQILEDSIDFNDTPITVTIPPTVGPSGKHYVIIGRILNTDGSYYGAEWQSDVFDLTGANGTWGGSQRQGSQLWGDDGTSCTGFACVKDCSDAYDLHNTTAGRGDTYQECANSCPDVDIAFGSSTRGGQPTAPLTRPTACPQSATTSSSETVTTGSPTATGLSRSSTRSAAAGVATGAASPFREGIQAALIVPFLAIAIAVA